MLTLSSFRRRGVKTFHVFHQLEKGAESRLLIVCDFNLFSKRRGH
jgi:hypothetical protein